MKPAGVISDYAVGAQKDDPLSEGDPCPTCGSPMSKEALAKQAGFPTTAPLAGTATISTAKPKPDAPVSVLPTTVGIIGTRG